MMNNNQAHYHFQQPQTEETQVTFRGRDLYAYRYGYARSAECQQSGDPGQDYLAFRDDGNRLVFVLCDGVSQSFIGDLAARFLGNHLVDWLWSCPSTQAVEIQPKLQAYLAGLVPAATLAVADTVLPAEIPAMLRSVLEEKRAQGSETMVVAGLVDFNRKQAALVSLGDMRLRAWGPDHKEKTVELGLKPNTAERWSTLRGVLGSVHVRTVSLANITSIAAYSDGLARIDRMPVVRLQDQYIQEAIDLTFKSPASDDVSFFQVWMDQPPLEDEPGGWSEAVGLEAEPAQEQEQAPGPSGPAAPPPARAVPLKPPQSNGKLRTGIIIGVVVALLLILGAAFGLRAILGTAGEPTATPTTASPSTATEVPPTRTPRPTSTRQPSLTPTWTASPTPAPTDTATVFPSPALTQPAYPAPETAVYPPPEPDAAISATGTNTAAPLAP